MANKHRKISSSGNRKDQQQRLHIASEAARILAQSEAANYQIAKQKAAARLGIPNTRSLPTNQEIDAALLSYQSLFQKEEAAHRLSALRKTAVEGMRFFACFSPHLVGSVLTGTATLSSDVNLHLFTDTAEDVARLLLQQHISFEDIEKRFICANETLAPYPAFRFVAKDITIEITVFPFNALRQAIRATVNGQPIQKATLSMVEKLMVQQE